VLDKNFDYLFFSMMKRSKNHTRCVVYEKTEQKMAKKNTPPHPNPLPHWGEGIHREDFELQPTPRQTFVCALTRDFLDANSVMSEIS
jgi:hypothetical protein